MAGRGALATPPALSSPVDLVDQTDPAVVTTPVDLADQAADPADRADRVDPVAHPVVAASAAGADLAAAAVAAEAAAGDATCLGVDSRSQRQQPRRGPQVLLPEATFQHLVAEDA
ncbi:unnamed protein product, partial [marine sediment metagenome]